MIWPPVRCVAPIPRLLLATLLLQPASPAQEEAAKPSRGYGIPIIDLPPVRTRSFFWQIWATNWPHDEGLQGSLSY